jgi:hypothetical protein
MRVAFIVDGFNVYHSLKAAEKRAGGWSLRWLDLRGLCATLLNSVFGPGAELTGVYYFSAYASHLELRNPAVTKRHRTYVEALKATGVHVSMGTSRRRSARSGSTGAGSGSARGAGGFAFPFPGYASRS